MLAASVARPLQDFAFDLGGHGQEHETNDQGLHVSNAEYQHLINHAFTPPASTYYQPLLETAVDYTPYGVNSVLPSQTSAAEPNYRLDQAQLYASRKPRQMSQVSQAASVSSHYGSPYDSPRISAAYQQQAPGARQSRKRSFPEDYTYDYSSLQHQLQAHTASSGNPVPVEFTPHSHHSSLQSNALSYQFSTQRPSPQASTSRQATHSQSLSAEHRPHHAQQQAPHHLHHHRLPNQPHAHKLQRTNAWDPFSPADDDHGPPSVVGQPGMPLPAPRPKGPKLKFTPEDDALLVELKETKNLTWKQIADFFPGRSSGTLQVRYCTKLKAKTTVWSDEMVRRLRGALQEYEHDRWRIVAGKVGSGFTAAACRDKALELQLAPDGLFTTKEQEMEDEEEETPLHARSHSHSHSNFYGEYTAATTAAAASLQP